ncbi:MAG TPA: citramalate synthase, partial [Tepidisphaeraceae bacterium]|nr:citramalate synthase [Tepidisphaeraceae bacterium]
TQGEGFNLSLQDKLQIALKLDELGVDYIEGGFPLSNPKDEAFFREIRTAGLKHAKVAAFGMTRRRGMKACEDPGLAALMEAQTPVVTIVGKSSEFQATRVLNVDRHENLAMIRETVALFREAGREVVYDAEHFFDAYKADRDYALATVLAAEEAGASTLCLCDTNGGTLPEQTEAAVAAVVGKASAKVGIHTHNDSALAVANALAAVKAGASHVQGTINGVGERCGNMDLIPLIANLSLKLGYETLRPGTLKRLTEVSRYVYEIANMNLHSGQPYVGASAFAHKGGMHVHAVQKDPITYEHIDPEAVGNTRRVLVSELSGQSNIAAKAGRKFEIENDKAVLKKVLEHVQNLENAGYQFEAAEASFELLLRREIKRHRTFFDLANYRVEVARQNGGAPVAEATVKLKIAEATEHTVAEGDGPVDALNQALRRALQPRYAAIADVHLVDYKVRVINARAETAAAVRVVVEWRRDLPDRRKEIFGTIGVSSNIIDASWQAIVDAYEYHLVHVEESATA